MLLKMLSKIYLHQFVNIVVERLTIGSLDRLRQYRDSFVYTSIDLPNVVSMDLYA